MANDTTIQKLLFDKNTYYERTTWRLRWATISFVLLALTLHSGIHQPIVYGLIGLAVMYNLLRSWKRLLKIKPFASFVSMNIADNLFVTALIYVSGGLASPYYIFLTLMIITATYWYGYRGLAIVGIYNGLLAVYFQYFYVVPADFHQPSYSHFIAVIFFIGALGYLVERLTSAEHQQRVSTEQANQQIELERRRLETLINSMGTAVVAIDQTGTISSYNGLALELLNTHADMHGQPIDTYVQVINEHAKPVKLIKLAKRSRQIGHYTNFIFMPPDGSQIKIDMTIAPIFMSSNSIDGYIFILRDITKEKTLEEERDEFVSVTSHELRTPIAIVEASVSLAQYLLKETGTDEARKALDKAHNTIVFLGKLTADLSTLARAERDILDVDLSMVSPSVLIKQLADDFSDQAKTKGLTLAHNVDQALHPILTSQTHIREILQNFITNALKYTPTGKIELDAAASKIYKGGLCFSVHDSGIGISASDKKRVFEKFFRSEDWQTRATGGTGLGLYITHKLADRLSGEISFDSTLGQGSVFRLDVPPYSHNKKDQRKVASAETKDLFNTL